MMRHGANTPKFAPQLIRGTSLPDYATSSRARAECVPALRCGAAAYATRSLADASEQIIDVRQFLLELFMSFPILGFPKVFVWQSFH